MPGRYATLSAISFRRNQQAISKTEEEQILALTNIYGINLTLSAIRYSKSSDLIPIANLLVQMGGFRQNLPECLQGIIIDEVQASLKCTPLQMEISTRLAKATKSSSNIELKEALFRCCKEEARKATLHSRLVNLSEARRRELFSSIRKYGPRLVATALISLDPFVKFDEKIGIDKFKGWLEAASTQSWQNLEEITGSSIIQEDVPPACPYRISRYFWAKTGQSGDLNTLRELGNLAREFDRDFMIYIMSTIPGTEINPNIIRLKCIETTEQYYSDERTRKIKTRN